MICYILISELNEKVFLVIRCLSESIVRLKYGLFAWVGF